ncbi:hypothetical protein N9S00_01800, partial [Luminiphilus sp.]|nr:hypothetical protein [Luminiphilus sp.]
DRVFSGPLMLTMIVMLPLRGGFGRPLQITCGRVTACVIKLQQIVHISVKIASYKFHFSPLKLAVLNRC